MTHLVEVVFALDQQGFARQAEFEGGQGQLVGGAAEFLGDPLQDLAEQGPLFFVACWGLQAGGELGAQPIQAVLVDGGVVGHIHLLDRFAHSPLEAAEEAALPGGEKEDGVAGATSPAGAADPVDVGLRIKGDVVVDHQADAIHIEAPGCHVGGHQHIHLALLEPFDRPFPLGLGHIAIEHSHVVAVLLEGFGHRHGDGLGAGKDDHPLTAFRFQHPLKGPDLVGGVHHEVALADAAGIGSLLLDGDLGRSVEVLLGNPADFARHGGREEHNLTLFRQLGENPFDVVDESHAQHLVGLVKHQGPQGGEVEGALAHVVHHPSRGANHDLHAAFELVDLVAEVSSAVDRQDPHMVQVGGITAEGIGHLDGEFPGGGEHQHLGLALLGVQGRQHGQGKGGRFAGAGLGLAHQVAAEHQFGDGGLLDR